MSQRHPEGYYEGVSDAGVAFDAANIVLARFVGDDWPEDTGRASYELMTQVALTTTLFRVARTQATTSRVDGANGAPRRQA